MPGLNNTIQLRPQRLLFTVALGRKRVNRKRWTALGAEGTEDYLGNVPVHSKTGQTTDKVPAVAGSAVLAADTLG